MKFIVTMKDPDALHDAIQDACKNSLLAHPLDDDEREALVKVRAEKVQTLCADWFEYGEYLSVEIDTDARTCTVVPQA